MKSGAFAYQSCLNNLLENLEVKELSLMEKRNEQARYAVDFPLPSPPPPGNSGTSSLSSYIQPTKSTAYNSLSTLLDLEDATLVRALGGLLSYLQATLFRLDSSKVAVHRVKNAKDMSFMKIDMPSLRSLHVFSEQRHPNIAGKSRNSKEGFSLFSLLNKCSSSPGSRFLRAWMLRPLLDKDEISFRHDFVELFMRTELASVVGTIKKCYHKFGDVGRVSAPRERERERGGGGKRGGGKGSLRISQYTRLCVNLSRRIGSHRETRGLANPPHLFAALF